MLNCSTFDFSFNLRRYTDAAQDLDAANAGELAAKAAAEAVRRGRVGLEAEGEEEEVDEGEEEELMEERATKWLEVAAQFRSAARGAEARRRAAAEEWRAETKAMMLQWCMQKEWAATEREFDALERDRREEEERRAREEEEEAKEEEEEEAKDRDASVARPAPDPAGVVAAFFALLGHIGDVVAAVIVLADVVAFCQGEMPGVFALRLVLWFVYFVFFRSGKS
jgi:hypothetical protein